MRDSRGRFIKGSTEYIDNLKLGRGWNRGLKGWTNAGSFKKGHPVPEEIRQKVSERSKGNTYRRGKQHTEEAKEKNRIAHLGRPAWNKGLKGFRAGEKHHFYGKKRPEISGEKAPNWKGGITPENHLFRNSPEKYCWQKEVFMRDDWTCRKCGRRGGELHAHHIYNFSEYPELRFDVNNGITLCEDCHREFHNKYGFQGNNKEQLDEWLSDVFRCTSSGNYDGYIAGQNI